MDGNGSKSIETFLHHAIPGECFNSFRVLKHRSGSVEETGVASTISNSLAVSLNVSCRPVCRRKL